MSAKNLKDHREIGRELDLFSFHEYAPGAIFWHPKGWTIYRTLQEFLRDITLKQGYQEISTPVLVKSKLFEKSGHWKHFKENMFHFKVENEDYSLKPMNCPESTLVFSAKTRSYTDLPLRLSEYGILHRNELTGVLGGAFRVRQFTIDDAHVFVRPDQIQEEINDLLKLVIEVYKSLNFNPRFYLATRPDKAMGSEKTWKEAETDLEKALKDAKVKYDLKPKDGAFYGPKIDIHIDDSQGRDWQLATIQLDFQQPESMDISYIDRDGTKKRPVMIHRGLTGSLERFIGILTEHFQGSFPVWLSPTQATVLPITDNQTSYAQKISKELASFRVEVDERNETLQAKIRDATLQKIPYIVIVGKKEVDSDTISLRTRQGEDLGALKISELISKMSEDIATKR
jgi:threonyl-tRNA synthetase